MKTEKAAVDNTKCQHKAACRTCHGDCFLLTPLLMLFLQVLFRLSTAEYEKTQKACQHTNPKTHTFAFCCKLNWRIMQLLFFFLYKRENKTSLPFSSKPLCPVLNSPSLFTTRLLFLSKRLPIGHLLQGQGTTATLVLLGTPYDLAFFSLCPWVTPT